MLAHLGQDNYGVWLLMLTVIVFFTALQMGHQQYILNIFNQQDHVNRLYAKKVFVSGFFTGVLINILQLFILLFFLYYNNLLGTLFKIDINPSLSKIFQASLLIIFLGTLPFHTVMYYFARLFESKGRIGEKLKWESIMLLFEFTVLVVALKYGVKLKGLAISYSIYKIFFAMSYLLIVLRKNFWDYLSSSRLFSLKIGMYNFIRSQVFTINYFFEKFNDTGINFLITLFINAYTIPLYSTLRTLTNSAIRATSVIYAPFIPELQKFNAKGNGEMIVTLFRVYWLISGFIINVGLVIILPFIEYIFKIWTKSVIYFNKPLFLLLALSVSIYNYNIFMVNFIKGINRLKQIIIITSIRSFIILITIISMIDYLGLTSIGLGIILAEIVVSITSLIFVQFELKKMNAGIRLIDNLYCITPILLVAGIFYSYYFYDFNKSILALIGTFLVGLLYIFLFIKLGPFERKKILAFFKWHEFN